MRRRSLPAALLTLLAAASATLALAGCGSEEGSSTSQQSKTSVTRSGLHTSRKPTEEKAEY